MIGVVFVLYFLAAFGFSFVVGHSKISLTIRELLAGIPAVAAGEPTPEGGIALRALPEVPSLIPYVGPWLAALMECVGCLGWHLGFVAGASGFMALPLGLPWWGAGLFLAFATAATNLLLAKYVGIA